MLLLPNLKAVEGGENKSERERKRKKKEECPNLPTWISPIEWAGLFLLPFFQTPMVNFTLLIDQFLIIISVWFVHSSQTQVKSLLGWANAVTSSRKKDSIWKILKLQILKERVALFYSFFSLSLSFSLSIILSPETKRERRKNKKEDGLLSSFLFPTLHVLCLADRHVRKYIRIGCWPISTARMGAWNIATLLACIKSIRARKQRSCFWAERWHSYSRWAFCSADTKTRSCK